MLRHQETQDGTVTIVSLSGDIETQSAPQLKELILRLLAENRVFLLFDLADLRYICSAGIAVFLISCERIHERNGRLSLCSLQGQVRETFYILRLNQMKPVLNVFESREEALREMKRS